MPHRLFRLGAALACLVWAGAASAAPFAYIAHDGGVAVIDTAGNAVVANVAPPTPPRDVAAKPGNSRAFIVSRPIHFVGSGSHQVILQYDRPGAYFMALSPADAKAVVLEDPCRDGPAPCPAAIQTGVHFFDTESRGPLATITLAGVSGARAAFHASGNRAFISDLGGNRVVAVSVGGQVTEIPTGGTPLGLFAHPSLNRLYVVVPGANAVRVIDLANNSTIATIAVGANPSEVVGNSSGTRLYVTNRGGNSVSVIDLATHSVIATIPVGASPEGIDVTPSGRLVYVVNTGAGSVSVISADSLRAVTTIPVGANARARGRFIGGPIPEPPPGVGVYSGLWFNPAEPGWGVHLTQRSGIVFAVWFTYGSGGNPHWYVNSRCELAPDPACPSCAERAVCTGAITETRGPSFFTSPTFDPSRVTRGDVGTFSLRFSDHDHAQLTYTLYGVPGSAAIERQLFAAGRPAGTNFTDLWSNPAESGWGMGITHQGGIMFLTWFVYDANGVPGWYVASRCEVTDNGRGCRGRLYRTAGPPGPRSPANTFDSTRVQVSDVGSIDVTFTDDNTAVISYFLEGGFANTKTITRQVF